MFLLSSCLHARLGTPARVPAPAATALADTLPMQPDASLDVSEAVRVMCTGLEFNGFPHADAGVERLFHWMTPQGRVKLAPCDRLAVDPSHDVRVRPRAGRRVAGGTLGVPAGRGDEQDPREQGPPAPPSRTLRAPRE